MTGPSSGLPGWGQGCSSSSPIRTMSPSGSESVLGRLVRRRLPAVSALCLTAWARPRPWAPPADDLREIRATRRRRRPPRSAWPRHAALRASRRRAGGAGSRSCWRRTSPPRSRSGRPTGSSCSTRRQASLATRTMRPPRWRGSPSPPRHTGGGVGSARSGGARRSTPHTVRRFRRICRSRTSTSRSRSTGRVSSRRSAAHASQAVPGSVLWRRLELLGDREYLRPLT